MPPHLHEGCSGTLQESVAGFPTQEIPDFPLKTDGANRTHYTEYIAADMIGSFIGGVIAQVEVCYRCVISNMIYLFVYHSYFA